MKSLEQVDFFKDNPIKCFVNTEYCKYKPGFSWDRDYPHDSLYIISDGSLKFTLNDQEFVAEKNDVVYLSFRDKATIANASNDFAALYFVAFQPSEVNLFCSDHSDFFIGCANRLNRWVGKILACKNRHNHRNGNSVIRP